MPTILVIWLAKLSAVLSKALGRGDGNALPGLVAERLQPDVLRRLGKQLQGQVVLVTGTNGKTTTTRMITAAVEAEGQKVLSNRAGSNLSRGILSTMILAGNWRGRLRHERAVFEVDEAAFAGVFAALEPKTVAVLNLFRDQLDRYGELNSLAAQIKAALRATPAQVILNADDPLVAWLGLGLANVSYFGLESAQIKPLPHDYAADSNRCPVCGAALDYAQTYYAHIGIYTCHGKDFAHPQLNVVGNTTKVNLSGSTSSIKIDSLTDQLQLDLPGLYNVYNALAAIAVSSALGVKLSKAIKAIQSMPPAYGRAEVVELGDKKLQLLLVKNPTGFNQLIQTYLMDGAHQPLLILINDRIADGRDVSWLWDVAFEDLDTQAAIVAGGARALDLALRLKYAEQPASLELDLIDAIKGFIDNLTPGATGLILPTYTAMVETRAELARLGTKGMQL